MVCEKINNCPFYKEKMPIESGLGAMYRKKYCETDKSICARYKVSSSVGGEHVPTSLYPNMHEQADQIISKIKK